MTEKRVTACCLSTDGPIPVYCGSRPKRTSCSSNSTRELEPRLGPDDDLGPIADWGSKLAGAVVRIAGLLHLAANLETGYRDPISAETFVAAQGAIGDYFLVHAIAADKIMGADPATADAVALVCVDQNERHELVLETRGADHAGPVGCSRRLPTSRPRQSARTTRMDSTSCRSARGSAGSAAVTRLRREPSPVRDRPRAETDRTYKTRDM